MKKHAWLFALALGVGSAVLLGTGGPGPDPAEAARGGTPGPPDSSGEEVPDYGDLIILLRDANGVPIPSAYPVPVPDPETGDTVDGGRCWQPIAATNFSYEGWVPPDDRVVVPIESTAADGGWLIPVDQYTCGVEAFFATHTQEVDFGRINEARSPDEVFESQLEDVVIKLATADSTSLDPAGRMVASSCSLDPEEPTLTSTVDSPLQSLAVYRQLMLTGTIGVPLPHVDDPQLADVLIAAARGLGTASDKGGAVNADMVAYLNQAMGLDEEPTILDPKLTQTFREEVQGEILTVEKQFLDFRAFGYDRGTNFSGPDGVTGGLPLPAYIPKDAPVPGTFEYLDEVVDPPTVPPTFTIVQGPIMAAVFANDPGFPDGNIGGFAQAADDTRAVIDYMHSWPIPDADTFATPVPCYPQPELTTYDVLISDVSGLQVPKQMVDGSEGREFVVTVANAGPDLATGTVRVTATAYTGTTDEVHIDGSPWTFAFTNLAAGASQSATQFFTVDLGERTTIDWTAVVEAEFDVNPGNNTATATTSVKVTGTGGGGGQP